MNCNLKLEEVGQRLSTLGLPIAYLQFDAPQKLPFIVFYESGTEITGADNVNLYRRTEITIELYCDKKTPHFERRIEALFNDTPILKKGDIPINDDTGKMIMTVFSFDTIQMIEEEKHE